jgi:enterochelin esterase-like enzyme
MMLDCGSDDFLLPANQQFHNELRALELPHQYEEFSGGHDWDYWDTHIQRALRFHLSAG